MIRILIEYVLPLLLPSLLYVAWWNLYGRRAAAAGGTPALLREGPWFWLILAGLGLAAAALIAGALMGGSEPGGTYIPPRLEDGRVIPGRVE